MQKQLLAALTACLCLCACSYTLKEAVSGADKPGQRLAGADRDAHNCIGSAGYTWSAVRNACVRLWEEGVTLLPAAREESATLAAYVVLSADGTKAELFTPVKTAPAVLERSFTPEGPRWTNASWLLKRLPLGWELYENGRLVYSAPNPGGD